jgi:hypothetical protein
MLSFLLAHPGASESDVIHHCGFTNPSHLHKRLKDLRDWLEIVLKKSGWRLRIKTEETRISCEWQASK